MAASRPDFVDGLLAQWNRERPELNVTALGLVGRLLRTAQLTESELSAGLTRHGLQRGWLDVLAALRRAGEPYELNPGQLLNATMLSSGGMTKRLDRLAEAGLLERLPDPSDRRGTRVRLTPAGKSLIDEAIETHIASEERLLESLTASERHALDSALRKLLAGLETNG
ncbi:MAG TPA: MarR family transcriptional regulator [Gaiellaceae bacterium]|nr:MarR family transcriptional regulator [Gaiellaceae bacterium]